MIKMKQEDYAQKRNKKAIYIVPEAFYGKQNTPVYCRKSKKTKDKRHIEVNTKSRYPDPGGIVQLYFIHHFI
jgi:hypothetical protein